MTEQPAREPVPDNTSPTEVRPSSPPGDAASQHPQAAAPPAPAGSLPSHAAAAATQPFPSAAQPSPAADPPPPPTFAAPPPSPRGGLGPLRRFAGSQLGRYLAAGLVGALLGGGAVATAGAALYVLHDHDRGGWVRHHDRGQSRPLPDRPFPGWHGDRGADERPGR